MSETNKTTSEDLYKLLLEDIRITDDKRFKVDKSVEKIRNSIIKGFEEQVFFETEGLGDPVSYKRAAEKSLMYYISSGDIAKVISLINSFDPTENHYQPGEFNDIGEVSENPFLQAISMFVSGITLYTRAALDGGLPDHIAYSLSDNYIKYGLMVTSIPKLNHLQNCALYDFTYQVHNYKYRNCGLYVKKCCEYIYRHLHTKITLSDLAAIVGKSEGYVSKIFEQELSVRPTVFIRDRKIEYAAHALEITDISVAALSDLLSFPSTSAFITYFKQKYGCTPLEYKKTHYNKKES
ncbi:MULTISPECIES: helix-turn-helix transcriptional regulator [unclassified Butyrivibrio]|uniref:helix-turn-helix transcriptional regulator n=1 Tax=unclassified Butyrivibrio TaxID=2639466 RepID=UPI0004291754|nr:MULTISPECIES: AraC family transcriptional regulator [unclassified Butyrivibrio]